MAPMIEPDLAALHPHETIDQLSDYHFPPYITLAHIFNAPRGWGFDNRILTQYALNYVISGNGQFTVEDRTYYVTKGDVFLYRPYEVHAIATLPEQDFLSITVVFHFNGQPFPFEDLLHHEHYLGQYANHAVEHYFAELVAKYRQPGLSNQLVCQAFLMLLLSETSQHNKELRQTKGLQHKNLSKLVLIKKHLEQNLQFAHDPKELQEISGLSWNYIISQFSQTFGVSPMQFLTWARVTKAKELALQTSLSFGEIAAQVGYNDIHSFGKMFKKKTGMSLTEFCSSVYLVDHRIQWPQSTKNKPLEA
jgi:AraC-like DNA-binding protein